MIDQTDELLRAGMERFAAGTMLPPRLATRAIRHRRRRGIAAVAGTAGTVAAAGAVIAAVAVPGSGPAGTVGHAETAAYVINHAESALASTGSQPLIENARVTGASGFGVSIGPDWIALVKGETGGSVLSEWLYPGKQKFATYSASGQPVSVIGWDSTGQQMTTTSVSYPARTWWHRTVPSGEPTPDPSGGCAEAKFAVIAMGPDLASWLRAGLHCGQFTLAGTEEVDGVRALKLKPVTAGGIRPGVTTYWVDPSSYLPVRSEFTLPATGPVRFDYRWLQPTDTNLASLDVTIPAGFTEVPPPSKP
jgi:hypothetical protein